MPPTINKLLLCLFTFLFFIVACQKNYNDKPATGSITGIVQPVGAVIEVTATDTLTRKSFSAIPDSSGKFIITPLQPGNYQLNFTIDSLYIAGAGLPSGTTVNSNKTTDLGVLPFIAKQPDTANNSTIYGNVSPPNAFGDVLLSSTDGKHGYKATPDANGYFQFTNIAPATYTLHFTVTDTELNAPHDSTFAVSKNQVLQLGNFAATVKAGHSLSKIDTLVGKYITETILLSHAPYDSLIVIQGNLTIFHNGSTDAVKEALNKITVITGYMDVLGDPAIESITMNRLTSLGAFLTASQNQLTRISFPALTSLTGLQIWTAPVLTSFQLGSLQQLSGTVSLIRTGLPDLMMFSTAVYKPFTLELAYNQNLTRIGTLNFGSDSVYNLTITGNPLLSSLDGLQGIRLMKNKITIDNNTGLQTLEGINNIVNTDQLQITNNSHLTSVCAAKTVINAVKDRPSYTERVENGSGEWVTITIDPFVAANNGSYVTGTDLINAVAQCP